MPFPQNTALLVIDVQEGFNTPELGQRNNPQAESNIKKLIEQWRNTNRPIIFIQHASKLPTSPFYPTKSGFAFKKEISPKENEIIIQKAENSAFIGTNLESLLHEAKIRNIVIVGLTTDHCVSTTTRMGANLGFNMAVVSDATATFDRKDHQGKHYTAEQIHAVHLASLHNEFAKVMSTDEIIKYLSDEN